MYLDNAVRGAIAALEGDSYFENMIIIPAYPYALKPTRLEKILITVSPYGMEMRNVEIGGKTLFGKLSYSVNVFYPHTLGSPALNDVMEHIVSLLTTDNISSVDVSPISTRNELNCYTANCIFSTKAAFENGGNDD